MAWQRDQVTMTRWMKSLVDAQVDAARAQGAFENLAGRGKPLAVADLAGPSAEQRFEALLFRSLGEIAPELALIRAVRGGRAALKGCTVPAERARLESVQRVQLAELTRLLQARRASQH